MLSDKLMRSVAAGAAALVVAVGGVAIVNSSSSNGTSGTASAQAAAPGRAPGPSKATPTGQIPKNWQPGTGTIITGAAADKAKAAAIAAKYQGTVNRVLKLSDGSYVVHIIATSGPHHVFVSQSFKVMGSE
jgi:hypothetical protein